MNIEELKKSNNIIFEAIVGSKLYGLDTPESDTDIKGVYRLPLKELLKRYPSTQINNPSNDIVYYEIKRFLELLATANPNMLELLYIPDKFVLHKHPIYDRIIQQRDKFLTKNIRNSLGGYAIAQIKKARGKNKKIVNPMSKERKTPLDFCYIIDQGGTKYLQPWLKNRLFQQEEFGVANIDKAHNVYHIFHNQYKFDFRGIIKPGADELRMSSIPEKLSPLYHTLYFASENYSNYCKDYKEYWEWMDNRNEARYASVEKHNKGYDGKNFMHCFRLLEMGIDAAKTGKLIVNRSNKDWLLKVKHGEFEYDYLVDSAEEKLKELDENVKNLIFQIKLMEIFLMIY